VHQQSQELIKLKMQESVVHHFIPIQIPYIAKLEDGFYSIVTNVKFGDDPYCISFDFDEIQYFQLLEIVGDEIRLKITDALRRRPFAIEFNKDLLFLCITAKSSKIIHSNDIEDYCPLIVTEFKTIES
jgi:hypothetical protein